MKMYSNKMQKLSAIVLFLIIQQVCSVPLIPQIGDEEEIVEVDDNALNNQMQFDKDVIDLSFYGAAMFGEPDEKHTGPLVANYTLEAFNVNPEELGSYLEGDILIPKQRVIMKNGLFDRSYRWPNGIVPYVIDRNFAADDISMIEKAFNEYHRHTCIRFVPRSNEQDYIAIVNGGSGCWSSVGRIGGRQDVNLQSPGCLRRVGTTMHELMHALGFLHEQSREERDEFVSIQYNNIKPDDLPNFKKADKTLAFGVPYDYGSIMHYSATAFSINGRPTIIPLKNMGESQMGQRIRFSAFDLQKLNKMYNCGYYSSPVGPPAPAPAPAAAPTSPLVEGVVNNIVSSFTNGILTGLLGQNEN